MLLDYIRLAANNLRRRRLRSWLTMLGIFIGITAVVSLISLGQGMEKAIEEQFFQLGADKIQVIAKGNSNGPPGANSEILLTERDLAVVKRARGVETAAGRLIEPIKVEFNDDELFTYVATLSEVTDERELLTQVANVDTEDMLAGRTLKQGDQWRALISEDYTTDPKFDSKALRLGDKIRVNGQVVDIVGVFKKTGNPFVDMSFVMNEDAVRSLLDIPEKYGVLVAKVSPGADLQLTAAAIEKDVRNFRGLDEGDEDFAVNTAEDILDTLTTVLGVVTAVLVGIAAISLLVGGIGITNTMYTAVLERQREIGVMKAIGAQNKDILAIFLIESGFLGLAGGMIGIAIGMGFSKIVEYAAFVSLGTTLIKANFPPSLIIGALAFSFIVGGIAGTFPALQASKLPPVEALRQ